jgi:hypothetical protein
MVIQVIVKRKFDERMPREKDLMPSHPLREIHVMYGKD